MVKYLCYKALISSGWTFESVLPNGIHSFVALGGPHTSNWDIVTALAIMYKTQPQRSRFLIKSSWTKFPLSLFFGPLGAVGVDRKAIKEGSQKNSTDTFAKIFDHVNPTALWIAPEGTRSKSNRWKTGHYYIAKKSNVPIVLAFADWKTKTFGHGEIVYLTDDLEVDMKKIMDFYKGKSGKIMQNFAIDSRYQ